MVTKVSRGIRGWEKSARLLGLDPITIRRAFASDKVQAVRVGINTRTLWGEIEHFVGKAAARLLVLSANASGHDQVPIGNANSQNVSLRV